MAERLQPASKKHRSVKVVEDPPAEQQTPNMDVEAQRTVQRSAATENVLRVNPEGQKQHPVGKQHTDHNRCCQGFGS